MGKPKYVTLTADEVETVTFTGDSGERRVAVWHLGTADDVWARADGEDPVAEEEGSYLVPPGVRRKIPVEGPAMAVRLVSEGTPRVEVEPG